MPSSSISGLSSGLDTATIIDQLMQLEAIPQARLKAQQDTHKSVLAALRALNTDTALLAGRADALAKPDTWQTMKATSSNSLITVSATRAAVATKLSVTVLQPAVAHQLTYGQAAALDATVVTSPDGSFTMTVAGVAHTLTSDGTLGGVTTAINEAGLGVTAAPVKTGEGVYRLQITADQAGSDSVFEISGLDTAVLGAVTERTGVGGQIDVGGIVATSTTNVFADIVPGLTITLADGVVGGAEPTKATVTVAQDTSGVKASLSALVEQLNALLTKIDTQTASRTATTSAGVLAGDSTARGLRNELLNTVFGDGTTSMASLGIQTDRYGKLVFDAAKFDEAYAADPAGTAAKFTTATAPAPDGWAARVARVAKTASDSIDGTIASAIAGRTTTLDRLTKSIEDWDNRLDLRRTALERTYTALETALNSLQNQASWLAGQIASLPTYSS